MEGCVFSFAAQPQSQQVQLKHFVRDQDSASDSG